MQLRDHPLMSYKGARNWPPAWTWISGEKNNKYPKGEVGVLKDVGLSAIARASRCFLIIEYRRGAYMGCLLFDDHAFCLQIFELLCRHRGQAVHDIAELDLGYTL